MFGSILVSRQPDRFWVGGIMLAIRLNGVNELGLPAEWPREVRELREGEGVPEGWVSMSKDEYQRYLVENRQTYDEHMVLKDLETYRIARILYLNQELGTYIETHYNTRQQATLNALFTESILMDYADRIKYIRNALIWIKSAILSYYVARNSCLAVTNINDLNKITINYVELDSTDPRITIEAALNILS